MTSIKPPSFPTPSDASVPTGRTEGPGVSPTTAGRTEGPSGSAFQQQLSTEQASQVSGAEQAAAASGPDPVAGLIEDVEAGRLSMDQAVDRLLTRTLAQMEGQLDSAQRAELSGLLRDALMNDPTLVALRGQHG
jgi:hypothetical protein